MMKLPKTQVLIHSNFFSMQPPKVPHTDVVLYTLQDSLNLYTEKSWIMKNYWAIYPMSFHVSGSIKIRIQILQIFLNILSPMSNSR